MKKAIALAAAAVMLLTLFTGCGKQPAEDNNTDKTTFTVGFDAEFPPYGYQDETGEYVGFDLDLAAEVCARNGWELVKKDSGITDYAGLAGKNVAVQADSSALAALTQNEDGSNADNIALAESFRSLTEVPDYNTAFLNLEAGAVDAIAMDIGVAQYQIAQRGDGFVILDGTIAGETYGVGFKLGNTELRDAVQKSLDEMVADGTFAKIAEKWGLTEAVCLGK